MNLAIYLFIYFLGGEGGNCLFTYFHSLSFQEISPSFFFLRNVLKNHCRFRILMKYLLFIFIIISFFLSSIAVRIHFLS